MMSKGKTVCVSLIVFGALAATMPQTQAQNQQPESVADAARRAREQKKEAAKPAQVITNDTLEPAKPAPPAANTETSPASAAPGASLAVTAAPSADQQASNPTGSSTAIEASKEDAGTLAELKALRQQIAEKQLGVDLAQRELALANDDFYSHPDFSRDDAGKAKLDALRASVTQLQDELAQLKAKLPAGASAQEEKPARTAPQTEAPSETQSQTDQQTQPQQRQQP